jgi:hypothetical protein
MLYIYIFGAPFKARNFNVVYIWTFVWQHWKPSLSICCIMFHHWISAECFPVSQLCVNTLQLPWLPLIANGIYFGSLRVNSICVVIWSLLSTGRLRFYLEDRVTWLLWISGATIIFVYTTVDTTIIFISTAIGTTILFIFTTLITLNNTQL